MRKTTWIGVGRSGSTVLMTQVIAADVNEAAKKVREYWATEGVRWGVIQYLSRGRFGENEIKFAEDAE